MNKTKFIKLNNGIRGVIVPLPGLNSVTVEVFLKIGSKYENKSQFGLSHFLEHMAFKGTVKRPSAELINNEIDSKGANYNAGTGQEMTSYYITTTKENVGWAIEMLSDILLNSKYDENEVLKERGVIIEEIKMYQDNPMMGLSGDFTKFLYGNSKIGCWNISGEVEDIEQVVRKSVIDYKNKFLNTKEIVVVVAGDVDQSFKSLIENNFGGFFSQDNPLPEINLVLNKEKEKFINKNLEQGHFCMGLPAVGWSDKRKYALKLLEIVLAGNSSSRLYSKIREEKALAYYVTSVGEMFKEGGYWAIQSGVKIDKLDEAMMLVRKEIETIADSLEEREIIKAKDYLLGKTKLAMDKTNFVAGFIGQKVLLENKNESLEEELEKYKKIKLAEVKELVKEIFKIEEIRTLSCYNRSK